MTKGLDTVIYWYIGQGYYHNPGNHNDNTPSHLLRTA